MDAKRMFQRVLSAWAMDVLALKRRGWDRPCVRSVDGVIGYAPARPRHAASSAA